MADPADTRKSASPSDSSSASDPVAMPDSNASEDATGQTVMQATLSETGEEASEVLQRSGAVGVGFKIGPYQLVRKLGQGGMGAVYEAQHTKLDKTFALKVLPPGFASNAAALSRFEREMKAVGKLDHPNIIRATNADEFNGTHYLVMEYVEGCDLSRFVKDRGTLSIAEACETIRQAALGLQHAHEHGLVHRDIKPSNLLVARSDRIHAVELEGPDESGHYQRETVAIKILDLGLARLEDDVPGGGLTASGQVLGTPDYMAPEQWDDTHAADARADLYALGCTLFFVLTGKAPFAEEGSKPSMMRLMKAHVVGPIPDLLAVRPDVPAELNSIYRRLLAKNPDNRFQTAAAVVTALESFTRQFVVPPSGGSSRSPVAPREESRTTSDSPKRSDSGAVPAPSDVSPAPAIVMLGETVTLREAPAAPFIATSTCRPDYAPPASRASSTVPPRRPRRNWRLAAGGAAAMVMLGVIIITITNKDGTKTRIEVPGDSKVEVTTKGDNAPAAAAKPVKPAMPKSVATTPSAPASDPIDFAAERQAAEWVLKGGGSVDIWDENNQGFVREEGKLPDRRFYISQLGVGDAKATDEDLVCLSGCRRLASVSLAGCTQLTSHGMESLARATTLKRLNLAGTRIDAATLPLQYWPQLENLDLTYLDGGDAVLQKLNLLPRLQELMISSPASPITDAVVEAMPRHLSLKRLYIVADSLSEAGYRELSVKLPHLEHLISFTANSEALAAGLRGMEHLQFLACADKGFADSTVEALAGLPAFHKLELRPGFFQPDGLTIQQFELLTRLKHKLRWIEFECGGGTEKCFTREAFQQLQTLSELREVQFLTATSLLVDGGLELLGTLPNLRLLGVISNKTDSNVEREFRNSRPDIELHIDGKVFPATSTIPFSVIQKLDETDPLPAWELPVGAPPPVVAPCEPTLATERQQLWAEFLKRPVIEELDVAALALSGMALATGDSGATSAGKSPAASAVPLTKRSEKSAATMKFALIPPGEFRKIFTRPSDPAIEPDMPVRRFRLTKPYALSTTEVTWDQFRQFVEATGYQTEAETNGLGGRDREFKPDPKINWRTPGWKPAPNEPVTQVTPRDAEAFCAWLTENARSDRIHAVDGKPTPNTKQPDDVKRPDKSGHYELYRLPTEAEWVHACRAGSVHKHVVGPEPKDLDYYAWSQGSPQATNTGTALHPVGIMKPNPFGLHDSLGNVWERTIDLLNGPGSLAPYLATNDPRGMPGANLAGASYLDVPSTVHPDFIMSSHPEPGPHIGFRVLKQLDGEPLPGLLDRPLVLRAGQPLSVHALVPRPEKIPGLQSWSVELAGPHTFGNSDSIATSSKGDLIATGSGFGKISLWDRDGNYQRALLGHEGSIMSLDFSPDGRWLASCERTSGLQGTGGDTARVWNVETGALHAVIPMPGTECHRIKFAPNGEHLAVSISYHHAAFIVIDLATGGSRSPLTAGGGDGLAWSPDGTELACSHGDNRLRVWDAKTLQVLRDVEAPVSSALEWSPDGNGLALRTSDGKVAIRDAKTLAVTQTFGSNVLSIASHLLAWLPDSQRLVVACHGSPSAVFNTTTGEQLAKFEALEGPFNALALRANGTEIVGEVFSRLLFYDTSTGQKLREGKERGGRRHGGFSVLSRDGREVFSQTAGKVYVSDAATGERRRTFAATDPAEEPKPSPDGSLFALRIIYGNAMLPVADSQTGAIRYTLSHGKGTVTRVAWSPDGKWLATGATDKLVRVWNVATGKIVYELAGHTGTIWSLVWSPNCTRLASVAEDKSVRLWDPIAGNLVATHDQFPEEMQRTDYHGNKFAWTADSRRLWIALSMHAVPLDAETGTLGPLENFSNGGWMTFLNTSPDGQRLLAMDGYGWTFVRGRDAQDRRLLGRYLGHTAQWHPDSRRFLGWEPYYGTVGFDVETNRRLGLLFPWLTGDHWLCLGPTGHYRGSPGVEDQIVYVAMLADGSQRTYTPAEFAKTFNWKNDPEKAELLGK